MRAQSVAVGDLPHVVQDGALVRIPHMGVSAMVEGVAVQVRGQPRRSSPDRCSPAIPRRPRVLPQVYRPKASESDADLHVYIHCMFVTSGWPRRGRPVCLIAPRPSLLSWPVSVSSRPWWPSGRPGQCRQRRWRSADRVSSVGTDRGRRWRRGGAGRAERKPVVTRHL